MNKANFKLKETPEQVALVQAIGSKNIQVSMEAQQALAAFIGPVIQKVLMTKGTASTIFTDTPYNEDDSPSYPLDLYYGEQDGAVTVWSQNVAGGLPTSQVTGNQEMKFMTYTLDSAVSFNKRYARKSRLDIVSRATERMINEVLVKQERNAWAVILKALAEASTTPKGGSALKHAIVGGSTFTLADLNNLMVRHVRLNESYSGNTPVEAYSNGPTDLYVSAEVMGQIRAFAYNPVNTTGASSTFDQTLPDGVRAEIYRNAGMSNIFGVNINSMVEFGAGKKYNTLFDTFAASTDYGFASGTFGSSAGDEVIVAIDNSRGAFVRPVARGENGSTFQVLPDDQFNLARVDKAGFWGHMEEGRVCLDSRAVSGIILEA